MSSRQENGTRFELRSGNVGCSKAEQATDQSLMETEIGDLYGELHRIAGMNRSP